MKIINLFLAIPFLLFLQSFSGLAQERLVIIGGGHHRPTDALSKFVEWSGEKRARILIIAWASKIPKEAYDDLAKGIAVFRPESLDSALEAPHSLETQKEFINQLKRASGVFFSGGDQDRIMDAIEGPYGAAIRIALREAYDGGVPFGGTSAGTAIMSVNMIRGSPEKGVVPMRRGLGFISKEIILDQHFSQRNRHARLRMSLAQNPGTFGLGIDEDTALLIENRRVAKVVGAGKVTAIIPLKKNTRFEQREFSAGKVLDLIDRSKGDLCGDALSPTTSR